MLRIYVTRQSRYPANTKLLKERVRRVLTERGATDCEVSIALVGERKMLELGKKYMKDNILHEVLSFPASGPAAGGAGEKNGFVQPQGEPLILGDIAICYPEARKIAMKRNRMMDDVLGELAEHGTLHLLGIHHE